MPAQELRLRLHFVPDACFPCLKLPWRFPTDHARCRQWILAMPQLNESKFWGWCYWSSFGSDGRHFATTLQDFWSAARSQKHLWCSWFHDSSCIFTSTIMIYYVFTLKIPEYWSTCIFISFHYDIVWQRAAKMHSIIERMYWMYLSRILAYKLNTCYRDAIETQLNHRLTHVLFTCMGEHAHPNSLTAPGNRSWLVSRLSCRGGT